MRLLRMQPTYHFKGRLPVRTKLKCVLAEAVVLALAIYTFEATEASSAWLTLIRDLLLIPATGIAGAGVVLIVVLRDARRLGRRRR